MSRGTIPLKITAIISLAIKFNSATITVTILSSLNAQGLPNS
jgi:hypothetical protein